MNIYLQILIGSLLVNNFVMNKFLGICPFLGVSVLGDQRAGHKVQTEHRHSENSNQSGQQAENLTVLFLCHYFTPPRGSLAVHFSI